MNLRKTVSDILYEIASAITQFADSITPTSDDVWRERRWRQYKADAAKGVDGPPLTEDQPVYSSRGVCRIFGGACPNVPDCPVVCERVFTPTHLQPRDG